MHHVPWIFWTSAAQTNVLDDWPAVAPSWTSLASRPSRAHWEDLIVYAQLNLIHGGTVTQEQQRILAPSSRWPLWTYRRAGGQTSWRFGRTTLSPRGTGEPDILVQHSWAVEQRDHAERSRISNRGAARQCVPRTSVPPACGASVVLVRGCALYGHGATLWSLVRTVLSPIRVRGAEHGLCACALLVG